MSLTSATTTSSSSEAEAAARSGSGGASDPASVLSSVKETITKTVSSFVRGGRKSTTPQGITTTTPLTGTTTNTASTNTTVTTTTDYYSTVIAWMRENWAILVLNLGSLCTLIGFTRSDVLELRSLSLTGSIGNVIYGLSVVPRRYLPMAWSSLFGAVNGTKIYEIVQERSGKVVLTEQQHAVYEQLFLPHGMTPKQLEAVWNKARVVQVSKGDAILKTNQPLDSVWLVIEGKTRANMLGRHLTAVSTGISSGSSNSSSGGSGNGGAAKKEAGVGVGVGVGGNVMAPTSRSMEALGTNPAGAWIGEMAFLEMYGNKTCKTKPPTTMKVQQQQQEQQQDEEGKVDITEDGASRTGASTKPTDTETTTTTTTTTSGNNMNGQSSTNKSATRKDSDGVLVAMKEPNGTISMDKIKIDNQIDSKAPSTSTDVHNNATTTNTTTTPIPTGSNATAPNKTTTPSTSSSSSATTTKTTTTTTTTATTNTSTDDTEPYRLSMYTIVAAQDCILLQWTHDDMEQLMNRSNDMRAALTRAMTAAIVGKVVKFSVSKSSSLLPTWSTWLDDWKHNKVQVSARNSNRQDNGEKNEEGEDDTDQKEEEQLATIVQANYP